MVSALTLLVSLTFLYRGQLATTELEEEAREFLKDNDIASGKYCYESAENRWSYATNITEENKQKQLNSTLLEAHWKAESWKKVMGWKDRWPLLQDETLKRRFKFLSILGIAALSDEDLKLYNGLQTNMSAIYSTAKICDFRVATKCDLPLEPDITRILTNSRDYDELEHVWVQWRDQSGRKIKPLYRKFVEVSNKAAVLNDFSDTGAMWRNDWESETFRDDLQQLWHQVEPLYQQLHAYVRSQLRKVYGVDKVGLKGPIPAHILGNMWAQAWNGIYKDIVPYPDKESVDVTEQLISQGYTAKKMFELSDEFFVSLNLTAMPKEFWQKSVIEKAVGVEMVCHASAWDFCNGKDFRIKQCTDVTMSDLITVHHEMGHVQYYLQYKDLPRVFRRGANPGFHEAIGDTIALSVSTPKHLLKVGLLRQFTDDPESDINFLLSQALKKIIFLPFGYLMDMWRYDVFSGATPVDDWNCAYWNLTYRLQGIKPPVTRTEDDFDAGAKYHVPGNTPYIRYFASHIIQFQFHKALCQKAGEYDPADPAKALHKCDIYESTEAGNALGSMLQLGMSKPWPEALQMITGSNKMDATALREYFHPLEEWLQAENLKNGEYVGWEKDGVYCIK